MSVIAISPSDAQLYCLAESIRRVEEFEGLVKKLFDLRSRLGRFPNCELKATLIRDFDALIAQPYHRVYAIGADLGEEDPLFAPTEIGARADDEDIPPPPLEEDEDYIQSLQDEHYDNL